MAKIISLKKFRIMIIILTLCVLSLHAVNDHAKIRENDYQQFEQDRNEEEGSKQSRQQQAKIIEDKNRQELTVNKQERIQNQNNQSTKSQESDLSINQKQIIQTPQIDQQRKQQNIAKGQAQEYKQNFNQKQNNQSQTRKLVQPEIKVGDSKNKSFSKQNQILSTKSIDSKTVEVEKTRQIIEQKINKLTETQASIYLYFLFFVEHYRAIMITYVKSKIPPHILQALQNYLYSYIDYMSRKLPVLFKMYHEFYKVLIDSTRPKQKKIYYDINYANLYGGAKIIMKSSPKIKSINSILEDGLDKYMYTDQQLPLKIIIGLNQQIAIDSISIKSYQMYSCIMKDFKVEGKFTMEDKKWVYLGTFKAEDMFGEQRFYTQRKIVRYIKITILSSYGKWSYFTLTQIQIRGKNLFADALTDKQVSSSSESKGDKHDQFDSHKQEEEDHHQNICHNEFKPTHSIEQPHESNLITALITKIDNLEVYNSAQRKELQNLSYKLKDVTNLLVNKTQQNRFYEQLLKQYKQQSSRSFYVILISVALSLITLLALVCLCLIRRKQLLSKDRQKYSVKKSSSFD